MTKEKKIGIKFILNKRLKSKILYGKTYYQVYARITFDRWNTKFPFPVLHGFGYLTEEEFFNFIERRENQEINQQMDDFIETVEKVIRFESKVIGEGYKIKGLPTRLSIYSRELTGELERYLKGSLYSFLEGKLDNEQLEASFHDRLFLEDSIYMMVDHHYPTLLSSLPKRLTADITSYVHFRAFASQYKGLERGYFIILDWLEEQHQKAFKDWIINPDITAIFKNESRASLARRMYQDFPANPAEAITYLKSIDNMILAIPM